MQGLEILESMEVNIGNHMLMTVERKSSSQQYDVHTDD